MDYPLVPEKNPQEDGSLWTPLQRWAPCLRFDPVSSSYQPEVRGALASPGPGLMSTQQEGGGQSSRKVKTHELHQRKFHSLPWGRDGGNEAV